MTRVQSLRGALILAALGSTPAFGATATSLSSFGGREEPTVRYIVSSDSFSNDSYVNMTDQGGGRFRMLLRFRRNDWWDGDRSTTSEDRQRAEVKVLGPRQVNGETFEYGSTWRTDSAMTVGNRFCHIFQVKGYGGGDIGAPLVTTTLRSGGVVRVEYHSSSGADGTARSWSWSPSSWTRTVVRLKISTSNTGLLQASLNGGSFSGISNTALYRQGAPEYQPKWGLYRGCDNNQTFGDNYLEHENVTANETTDGGGGGGGTITGYKRIVARHSGKDVVVQSASTSDGANVFQYTYSSGTTRNDEWEIISVGSGYYRVMNRHSGKALVVQSASTANGANVIQWTYGGSQTNDEWAIEDVGGGYYRFINRHSGKALDVLNSGTSNSVNIQQDAPDGGTNQQFQLISL